MENVQRKAGRPARKQEPAFQGTSELGNIAEIQDSITGKIEGITIINEGGAYTATPESVLSAHMQTREEEKINEIAEIPIPGLSEINIKSALEHAPIIKKIPEEDLEKIKQMPPGKVEYVPPIPEGYESIKTAPHNGVPIIVTDGKNTASVTWRKTRAFANATHRWEETGLWSDELSGQKINFNPTHWKHRERRR